MKTFVLFSLAWFLAPVAFGQGAVEFRNRVINVSPPILAPVYGVNPAAPGVRLSGNATTNGGTVDYTGVPLLIGSNYIASLWAAPLGNSLVAQDFQFLASTTFLPIPPLAGYWRPVPGNIYVPWVAVQGEQVMLQVRAWDSRNGTVLTWPQVLADETVPRGYSDDILYTPAVPPFVPGPMFGLRSFNLTAVPEPGFAGFGSLGIVAGLAAWFRRRCTAKS